MNGLTMGSIYALLAIGVTMIYKSMGMLNVAHADTIMLSAYIALTLYRLFHSLVPSIIIAIIAMGGFGLLLERFIYRRLKYDSFVNLMIATIGMQIILRNTARMIWGVDPSKFPNLFSERPFQVMDLYILPQNIYIILISAILVILLQLFYKYTRTGKSMMAAAANAPAAMMLGINVSKTRWLTFGISGVLACCSGILLAPMFYVSPDMGISVGLKGFSAAIVGGFGSVSGAMMGGILLGLVESIGASYVASAYRDLISFAVMILILYLKPSGLFARRVEQKF